MRAAARSNFSMPSSAARLGRRAGRGAPARIWRTADTGGCPGRNCSSRRSRSRKTDSPSARACTRLIAGGRADPGSRRATTSTTPTGRRSPSAGAAAIRPTRPRFARIAAGGADAFYKGDIARDIVDTVDRQPAQSRRHDAGRSRRLSGEGARAGVRCVSRAIACAECRCRRRAASLCCRCSASSRPFDLARLVPASVLERASHERSGSPGVRRSQRRTSPIPISCTPPTGLARPRLSAHAVGADPCRRQHGLRAAGRSAPR